MKHAAEIELKLAVPPAALPCLRRRLAEHGPARHLRLLNRYFDTPDRLLARHAMALRLRRKADGAWEQTLKIAGGAGALTRRGEWNAPLPPRTGAPELDPQAWQGTPLARLLKHRVDARLAPVFEVAVRRSVWEIEHAGARFEVALDVGETRAGPRRAPVCELELELLCGSRAALIDFARALLRGRGRQRPLALAPATESKAARGGRLLKDCAPRPVRADADAARARWRERERASALLREQVRHGVALIATNQRGLAELGGACEPGFVHQMRLGLRRWRSALGLLAGKHEIPAELRLGLGWLSGALGLARDADVWADQGLPALIAGCGPAPPHVLAAARAARAAAYLGLRVALESPRYAQLMIDWMAWAESEPPPSRRAGARGRRRLLRQARRMQKGGVRPSELDETSRHEFRNRAKRLRYALEWARPQARAWIAALTAMQDALGEARDAAVALSKLQVQRGAWWRAARQSLTHTHAAALARADRAWAALSGLRLCDIAHVRGDPARS